MNDALDNRKTPGGIRLSGFMRTRLRRHLSFYLTALLLIAIVPPFVFSMIILKRSADEQERVVTDLLEASTGSVTRIVERQVDGFLTTLRVLSASRSMDIRNIETFYLRATAALSQTGSFLIVIDRSHNQLFNTRVPFGTPLAKASDPASIDAAFASDGLSISNVFFGGTARKWVFNVYLPVRNPLGNGDYLLALTQDAESMSKAVDRDVLSPGWEAALLDRAGKVIASSDRAQAMGAPFFAESATTAQAGIGEALHDGTSYRTVTEISKLTGWRIVAWARSADIDQPALWSYVWLSLSGVLFAALAVAGSLAIARILAQGVKLLARDAHLLGTGRQIAPRRHIIAEIETVSAALSQASQARAKADMEIRFLMREVAHRSKNQLTVIQSMLNQSVNSADNRQEFVEAFRKRVAGLARSTDLMIANAAQGVDMHELAQNQLQPFIPDDPARVRLSGPTVRLDTQVSQTLGMALHELATNATKYGALANVTGIVDIGWTIDDAVFLLVWREEGADLTPQEQRPQRKGFGTMVLERMLVMALDAKLERIMHPDGIEWQIRIALHRLNPSIAEPI